MIDRFQLMFSLLEINYRPRHNMQLRTIVARQLNVNKFCNNVIKGMQIMNGFKFLENLCISCLVHIACGSLASKVCDIIESK